MNQHSDLIENFFPQTIFNCILPNLSLSISKKQSEELLKGVAEKQNVTMLPMQHNKRSHICSSLFLVTQWTCPADLARAAVAPTAFSGTQKQNTSPVRDLDSAAQEPKLCLPWGTACCFSVQPKYSGLPAADKRLPKTSTSLFRQDTGTATVNFSMAFLMVK